MVAKALLGGFKASVFWVVPKEFYVIARVFLVVVKWFLDACIVVLGGC